MTVCDAGARADGELLSAETRSDASLRLKQTTFVI